MMEAVYFVLVLGFAGVCQSRGVYKDDNRIVGGQPIDIELAPYQVSLQSGSSHVCGGTIVHERFVVTAAHCVAGSSLPYKIRAGSESLSKGGKSYTVEKVYTHPEYYDLDYDIALLKLKSPIELGDKVATIEMVDEDLEIEEGSLVEVVGWGVTREGGWYLSDKLQRVVVPALSQETCSQRYRGIFSVTTRMICAGIDAGGKDSCQGDSGGGLTYEGKLAGVVSFGLGCARPSYPGVYSRIATLRSWVDGIISTGDV